MTRSYPIICPSCNSAGVIGHPDCSTLVCKACNGSGIVICTEGSELYKSPAEHYIKINTKTEEKKL